MARTSVKALARDALKSDNKQRKAAGMPVLDSAQVVNIANHPRFEGVSHDSFVNMAQKMGIGADNPLSTASYGFNPITRRHVLLEWIHRGSWLGGVAVDVVADDMTRMGIEYVTEMPPEDALKIDELMTTLQFWGGVNDVIKWGRLYGGCLGVILIDGQDMRTPLRTETVGKDQFKGVLALDRWMVEPDLTDLVTEQGPHMGKPKYYRIGANAPAMRGQAVHYSRCIVRHVGIKLPYNQALTENLWGLSVLERLYDRMVSYDSASTGVAQLIYKSYLRTLSIEGMREIAAAGGPALDGLIKYTEMMRRFQGIEGITLIDGKDKFEAQVHGAFSGLADALNHFAEQLSGALQIPLTRLFGQAPAGLNATGDNDMRNYYDMIKQRQESDLKSGVTVAYKCAAASEGILLPDDFQIGFRTLWQLNETDKSTIAKSNAEAVLAAHEALLISDQVALRELRQSSRVTGVFTNITTEDIDAADDEIADPGEGLIDPLTGEPLVPSIGEPDEQGGAGKSAGAQRAMAKTPGLRAKVRKPAAQGGEGS